MVDIVEIEMSINVTTGDDFSLLIFETIQNVHNKETNISINLTQKVQRT